MMRSLAALADRPENDAVPDAGQARTADQPQTPGETGPQEPGHDPTLDKASEILGKALRSFDQPKITLEALIAAIGERAFGLILILFALPNCVPAPPGVGSIMGVPLILLGVQLARGRRTPWLPRVIGQRQLSRSALIAVLDRSMPYLRRLERICRPRFTWLTGPEAERLYGILIVVLACAIAIPLPFTNFVPAVGIAFIALGLLEEDGVTAIIGVTIGTIGLAIVPFAVVGAFQLIMG